MASADVDLVERFRSANVGDFDALVDSDAEWVLPKRTLRGIDEIRAYYAPTAEDDGDVDDGFEHLDVSEERGALEDAGDGRVAATNRYVYRWKENGEISYERRTRLQYTIRDGKIVRYEAHHLPTSTGGD